MSRDLAPPQYLTAEHVLEEMAQFGSRRVNELTALQIVVLGCIGGGFITIGALLSMLLAAGVATPGLVRLLEGLGFSAGFFFVILSGAALFTEANVVLPATLLYRREQRVERRLARFWILAWAGNLLGAFVTGWAVHLALHLPREVVDLLSLTVKSKMAFRAAGGAASWGRLVVSGVLANWLVGMAAFFAVMGRTIIGKYVPVFLAVTAFVAAGFQHSPANMGYFALITAAGGGPGWAAALAWSIVPAGIGNILGGAFLVALPFWFAQRRGGARSASV